jgi:hypothetical protein
MEEGMGTRHAQGSGEGFLMGRALGFSMYFLGFYESDGVMDWLGVKGCACFGIRFVMVMLSFADKTMFL